MRRRCSDISPCYNVGKPAFQSCVEQAPLIQGGVAGGPRNLELELREGGVAGALKCNEGDGADSGGSGAIAPVPPNGNAPPANTSTHLLHRQDTPGEQKYNTTGGATMEAPKPASPVAPSVLAAALGAAAVVAAAARKPKPPFARALSASKPATPKVTFPTEEVHKGLWTPLNATPLPGVPSALSKVVQATSRLATPLPEQQFKLTGSSFINLSSSGAGDFEGPRRVSLEAFQQSLAGRAFATSSRLDAQERAGVGAEASAELPHGGSHLPKAARHGRKLGPHRGASAAVALARQFCGNRGGGDTRNGNAYAAAPTDEQGSAAVDATTGWRDNLDSRESSKKAISFEEEMENVPAARYVGRNWARRRVELAKRVTVRQ